MCEREREREREKEKERERERERERELDNWVTTVYLFGKLIFYQHTYNLMDKLRQRLIENGFNPI